MKINTEAIIKAYNSGKSLNSIAKKFNTHATTIRRILLKNNIELRHDNRKAGLVYVEDGGRLIKWAKAQGRPVTKKELAKVIGTKRLSPSYFIKYPELGQYVITHEQNDLQIYTEKLYKWLQENNIPYKPNDRTKLKVSVTALLLDDYSDIVMILNIKPKCVSKKKYEQDMEEKLNRAYKTGTSIIWVKEEDFKNLDDLKKTLEFKRDVKRIHIK